MRKSFSKFPKVYHPIFNQPQVPMNSRKLKGSTSKETKLLELCQKGKADSITKLLTKREVNVSCRDVTDGVSPLHVVAELSFDECCEVLLKYGAEVDSRVIQNFKMTFS